MSKTSISRDRWRQLGQTRYTDWCPGCGLHLYVNGEHRVDCTVERRGWCPSCLAYLPTFGVHRADCTAQQGVS